MVNDFLYLVLAEKELFDCIRSEKKQEWELLRSKDYNNWFTTEACSDFFPARYVLNTENMVKENLVCSRKNLDAPNYYVCVARPTAVTNL